MSITGRVEFVGPQVGEELKVKGVYAVVFALVGIMAYVWWRFEWQFGLAAVISLIHDVFAVLGVHGDYGPHIRSFDAGRGVDGRRIFDQRYGGDF